MANEPIELIPCLRHFWHVGCGAAFGAKSKWERVIGDIGKL